MINRGDVKQQQKKRAAGGLCACEFNNNALPCSHQFSSSGQPTSLGSPARRRLAAAAKSKMKYENHMNTIANVLQRNSAIVLAVLGIISAVHRSPPLSRFSGAYPSANVQRNVSLLVEAAWFLRSASCETFAELSNGAKAAECIDEIVHIS